MTESGEARKDRQAQAGILEAAFAGEGEMTIIRLDAKSKAELKRLSARRGPTKFEVYPPKNQDLLDWLLTCPEKGFFVPLEAESTETL